MLTGMLVVVVVVNVEVPEVVVVMSVDEPEVDVVVDCRVVG